MGLPTQGQGDSCRCQAPGSLRGAALRARPVTEGSTCSRLRSLPSSERWEPRDWSWRRPPGGWGPELAASCSSRAPLEPVGLVQAGAGLSAPRRGGGAEGWCGGGSSPRERTPEEGAREPWRAHGAREEQPGQSVEPGERASVTLPEWPALRGGREQSGTRGREGHGSRKSRRNSGLPI